MDSAHQAFFKNEERLHRLSAPPSEIVRRQVRVTPYPHEDAGWIIRNTGEEVCLFSSDFPHVEGGRNPMKRFDDSLVGVSPAAAERFFCDNFVDLMGEGLAEDLRRPRALSPPLEEPAVSRLLVEPGVRNAAVFLTVVVAMFLIRFFRGILTPLVVATFLLLLIDGVSRVMHRRLPSAPGWVRDGAAGALILAAFAFIGVVFAIEAPPFAGQLRSLAPRIDLVLGQIMRLVGARPVGLRDISSDVDPARILGTLFYAARMVSSYGVLVIVYFGFLVASRAAFGRKLEALYESDGQRTSARRVMNAVSDAVER